MIDHLAGRPNPSWKRAQVFLVVLFWLYRILRGNPKGPRIFFLRRVNRALKRFTPWQLIVSTLAGLYTVRNLDKILGLGAPEPLARLYSPSYYRATWISTGLDAGFATAMSIRPKWMRDICSVLFSVYYIIYANEGDEKLRKFRAVPTVEMLRTTWEKTTNPYIRLVTSLPSITIRRKMLLPRPKSSSYQRPITVYLFFALPQNQLSRATDLILDFPGGGFVAMTPEHHEYRLRTWAIRTGRPVLSVEYGKAPEYPYPFAIDEAFDTYRVLVESVGTLIGMSGRKLNIVMTGDSAGATLAVSVVVKALEHNAPSHPPFPSVVLPMPLCLVLSYAALDFNFTSWMTPTNLRVLRSEQSSGNLPGLRGLAAQKDHLQHVSPLSMVGDKPSKSTRRTRLRRRSSWREAIRGLTSGNEDEEKNVPPQMKGRHSTSSIRTSPSAKRGHWRSKAATTEDKGDLADGESGDEIDFNQLKEEDKPIQARVRYKYDHSSSNSLPWSGSTLERQQEELSVAVAEADSKATLKGKSKDEPIGTTLTMTSRTGYFQDRIISPTMMRAMAILYIGPHRNPDFATDYRLSPILTPSHLLARFPPLLMQCGEKDPFVDDTVIFAGRVREAKRARKAELDLVISGKSARFGEGLRMTEAGTSGSTDTLNIAKKERDQLAQESEDDWVQMVLFSDWSHGYLQMPSLMMEAKGVIDELGNWMDDAFWRYTRDGRSNGEFVGSEVTEVKGESPCAPGVGSSSPSPFNSETEDDSSSGITFAPRRHQTRLPTVIVGDVDNAEVVARSSSGSDATLLENEQQHTGNVGLGEDEIELKVEMIGSDEEMTTRVGTPTKPVKTGQTITETELMRRRRLLDSHIFD